MIKEMTEETEEKTALIFAICGIWVFLQMLFNAIISFNILHS